MSVDFIVRGKDRDVSLRFGYFGFFRFRNRLVSMADARAGEIYCAMVMSESSFFRGDFSVSDADREYFAEVVPPVLKEFAFMPDSGGKLDYGTAGKLYNELRKASENVDLPKLFGNSLHLYISFVDLLAFSYRNRRQVSWS